jgi:fatty acid desaturase
MHEIEPTPRSITWYRTPLDSKVFKSLHEKSDLLGWLQAGGFLAPMLLTGGIAFYSSTHWPLGVTLLLLVCHGMLTSFHINAVHELGHNTVFRTKVLNVFFAKFFAFFTWMNDEMFDTSHTRHHRYTLHQPDDLEVVLPVKHTLWKMLLFGIFNPAGIWWTVSNTWRIAHGKFKGEWELKLFPPDSPEGAAAMRWARVMLIGHGLIIAISVYFHLWILPFLTTFSAGIFGSWLQNLCNNTQHIGLQDDVADFRLCCRTFTLNPFVQFLYWHMNYHIEHHMFAAVPCYRLGRLHRLIKHDLPPCPHGLVATWKEIIAIQEIQKADPDYQHEQQLPQATLGRDASPFASPSEMGRQGTAVPT